MIETVLAEFDFEKAAKVYAFMGWTWSTLNPPGVPTTEDLERRGRDLLEKATEAGAWCRVSTGGLRATYDHGKLTLEFVAVEAEDDE